MRSRNYLAASNICSVLCLLVISLFSIKAYSVDQEICTPSNGFIPRIDLNVNITVQPAGSQGSVNYTSSIPVATPGPITCPHYTPTDYSVFSSYNGAIGPDQLPIPIGDDGFSVKLLVGTSPGYVTGTNRWGLEGNTPVIPSNIYPSVIFQSPSNKQPTHDIVLKAVFVGYIIVTGKTLDEAYVPSDTSGLTAVYLSGTIHIPPYCIFTLGDEDNTVTMYPIFASEFAGVSPGEPVGKAKTVPGKGQCSGGTSGGVGDVVHIRLIARRPVDGGSVIGIDQYDEIGIQVRDREGKILPVNGVEADQVTTYSTFDGESRVGAFDFPLQFQLVSRTGTAPELYTQSYNAFLTLYMLMD